ncbi:hypothetical protein BDM02DRAFT_978593 [Thelephora ganbajun]|uniref:Uncharacterized protein n=1 Tax=Thelephora ganbajun TaxID=370292 RepID=A0ACB6ZNQ2_THEGA|nr:hypothetical protein BDM02DRAFT_978593 [Thelephora ganbajun]
MAAPASTASAPFSRLQLAAALLEYDNDLSNPDCPFRSAADSAIFAQFRQHKEERARSAMPRHSTDHLAVKLPSDRGSVAGRESALDNYDSRRSRASIDVLRNPFSPTEGDVEEGEEENMDDLDLESWGLNDLLGDKGKEKGSRRKPNNRLSKPHEIQNSKGPLSPGLGPRAVSMGNFDNIGFGGVIVDDLSIKPEPRAGTEFLHERKRRASFGSPLDLAGMNVPDITLAQARRKSAYGLLESQPEPGPSSLHSVPFPSSPSHTDDEPGAGIPRHGRTYSSVSRASRLHPVPEEPGRRPRFDSQGNRIKTTAPPQAANDENNPFAIRPPSPSRSSRFDPKAVAHTRTVSNASMGSRVLLDDATSAHRSMPRRYPSRMDLLRPKVLIMPSPLQNSEQNARPPSPTVRDGFQLSRDGPPLPAGARAVRKSMAFEELPPPNPFTPNSRATLSLAQLTFRGGLHTQDIGYSENAGMPRALADGEQARPPSPEIEEIPIIAVPPVEKKDRRGPGKLYGKSLIDDLEARKAEMRGKRRVFTGDERPSMMARSSTYSTLIDPNSLNRPVPHRLGTSNSSQGLTRRKTLLNFDEDKLVPPDLNRKSTTLGPRASNARSVFGTDHIWEREMTKLREMEVMERETTGLSPEPPATTPTNSNVDPSEASPRPRSQAPTNILPEIPKVSTRKGPPPPRDDDDDEESDSDNSDTSRSERSQPKEAEGDTKWFSDEEKPAAPVRTVGSGPRYPPATQKPKDTPTPPADDSDEDVPLAATVGKAVQRATKAAAEEESDEDKPLNALIDKTKSKLFLGVPGIGQPIKGGDDDEDEDDQPLGLRASQLNPRTSQNWLGRSGGDDEDDDVPLGLHPEHQRRTQYQMFTQQQQFAQQQMMMQAQLQSSMMFTQPSFMGSGFFGPPVGMSMGMGMGMGMGPMMVPPVAPGTPPPVQDPAKFGRVDAWRRDVAVEGEPI